MYHKLICRVFALLMGGMALNLCAQGTAFMYQGQLDNGGSPANGSFDLRFALFDAATNGNAIGLPQTNLAVQVAGGLFTTNIDFGPVFNGANYWLGVGVRSNGNTGTFTLLWPRQKILPVPYAIFATSAGSAAAATNLLGTLPATQLTGTVPSAQIAGTYQSSVNFTNSTNSFNGSFFGNGQGLTNLNGSQITTGTVADARLSSNVALLNTNQTFTGTNSFTGPNTFSNGSNSFTGTFTGNGSGVTNLNGSQITSGTVADARLSANVALLNANQTFTGTNLFTKGNSFTNRANAFTGSFFGNGLVGWIPVSGTSTQAVPDAGYLMLGPSLSTLTLPASSSLLVDDIIRISGGGSGGWVVLGNIGQSIFGNFLIFGNSTWSLANSGTGGNWRSMTAAQSGSPMYVGGDTIYKSDNYGVNWNPTGIVGGPWYGLACSADGTRVYAAPNTGTGTGIIQVSTNGGAAWKSSLGGHNWTAIACSDDGSKIIAAASPNDGVYVSIDYGTNFTKLTGGTPPISANWSAVTCSADGSRMAAAVNGGNIYYSVNGTWASSGSAGDWTAMAASSDGIRLVACNDTNPTGGKIFISSNGGANWTPTAAPVAFWNCLAASGDCTRIVAGSFAGSLYGSANFGTTWSSLNVTNGNWFCAASSADGGRMAAGTDDSAGKIYYSGITEQFTTTTNGLSGSQGSAVELQYIGTNQFIPVSMSGHVWSN